MATDGEANQPNVTAAELRKQKAILQGKFTRTYNALSKLLLNPSCSKEVSSKSLEDLEHYFQLLESKCDEINLSNDPDETLDNFISEKYDNLIEMRSKIATLTSAMVTKTSETAELIRSFQATLTLPKPHFKRFSGNATDYCEFMSYVETYIETVVTDPKQRLTLLIDTCDGVARESVAYLIQSSDAEAAYKQAKIVLKDTFGQKHQIVRAVLDDCSMGPAIGPNDLNELKRLVINMKKAQVTLTECGSSEELLSTEQLVRIYRRLPRPIQNKWNDKVFDIQEKEEKPSFQHMHKLIDSYVKSRDNEYFTVPTSAKSYVKVPDHKEKSSGKPVYAMNQNVKTECIMCKNNHFLNQCPEFLKLSLKSKYEFVSQKRLCRNCFHGGHIANKCKRKSLCRQCSGKHNDALHDADFKNSVQSNSMLDKKSESNVDENTVLSVTKNKISEIPAGIACVEVLVEGSKALYKCKAIVDHKSSVNLCSQKLADKLQLPSVPFQTTFNVATGSYVVNGMKVSKTKVYSNDMQHFVCVNDMLTVKSIPLSMNSIFTSDDIAGMSHLEGVTVPKCSNIDEIDLLIGSSVPKAFHQYEQRMGSDDEIYAVRLTLGWDLVGPKKIKNGKPDSEVFSGTIQNVFLIDRAPTSVEMISKDLEKVFSQDFNDCSLFNSKLGNSIEDTHALQLVKNSMSFDDKSFCVGIPWKQNPLNLPSNKNIVMKRQMSLKKRLQNDLNFLSAYASEMNKYIDSGFIELSKEDDTDLCHYIPHHAVWHPRKGSLRVVWDCAMSLNDFIFEGPDLLNSLTDVLIRFRRFKYAVTSDIRKMYLNVKVPSRDRGALRILWWPNGDLSKQPIEYRAAVHIFGAKSSGFVANYCVQSLTKFDESENQLVANTIKNDFYVDDQASSIQSEEQAVSMVKNLSHILSRGGFHLTKFVSNSTLVMNSICETDHKNSSSKMQNEHSVLGLKWSVETDELKFPCSVPNDVEVPTCKSLLSAVAQIYDPLGVVSPVTLPVKVLLQTKTSLGWDKSDTDIVQCWDEFLCVLKLVTEFSIPRCFKPKLNSFDVPSHVSLHGFSDASKYGYSAVVYIRQVSIDGEVAISFVLGKSRVAPKFKGQISTATVPKLELNAAALLAKLVDKAKNCIEITIHETVYWCDSQAVLSCLLAIDKRFPVYWSNRIALILGLSDVKQWRYVPTKCNPADIGSRGIQYKNFSKQMQIWVNGPGFLLLTSDKWPEITHFDESKCNVFATDVTVAKNNVAQDSNMLQKLVEYYSKLTRLLRIVKKLLCFMKNVQKRNKGQSDLVLESQEENENETAKLALIRFEQRLLVLSDLKRLKPFKDENGIYRVHSRLSNMNHLTFDERCPIILPKRSNLTKLIIQDEHENSAHMGINHVLTQLRSKYWVIGGKSTVKNATSWCRKCKEENARPMEQTMCPLPEERGRPSFPFQYVGLDYFGPFFCKCRRQRFKRYGCIFVCLASRAVHIECVSSLETNAFLCAFSRFIARRGKPEKVYSDNATNFKGSQDELGCIVDSLNETGQKFAQEKGFVWHFHPPQGSHHGGHYERFIRSTRRVLRGITNEQEMSEDNLTTFLCEVEKILNDRPLTKMSDDPNDSIPITPNLILLLRGNSCKPMFDCENNARKCFKQAQFLASLFWKRWLKEYVSSLQTYQKWLKPTKNLKVGDLVFMINEGYPRGQWPIAKVVEVFKDSDGLVRKVTVQDKNGFKMRPITKLALLEDV